MKTSTPTKLTLRLDVALIRRAKNYAHEQDRSVSQLVADYFAHLTVRPPATGKTKLSRTAAGPALGPITSSLRGALRPCTNKALTSKPPTSRDDYRAHLEAKYL